MPRNDLPDPIVRRMVNQTMPNDIQAEQAVLESAFFQEQALHEALQRLTGEDFYYPGNRDIFEAMQALYQERKAVDLVTVSNKLDVTGKLEALGGYDALAIFSATSHKFTNFSHYIDIVLNLSSMRKLIQMLQENLATCFANTVDAELVADQMLKVLIDLRTKEKKGEGLVDIGRLVAEKIEALDAERRNVKPSRIQSGFSYLDYVLGGFRPGALYIIAARPAMGKTALALTLAYHAARFQARKVAFFSLEMGKDEMAGRFMALHFAINSKKIVDNDLNEEEFTNLEDHFAEVFDIPIYIDDHSIVSPVNVLTQCRALQAMQGLDMIIIDYLQLMESTRSWKDNKQQEVAEISRNLKIIAKDLGVPVIALSQLSRSCELRTDKRPMLSDLRESGAIEQDADVVCFLYRDFVYHKEANPGGKNPAREKAEKMGIDYERFLELNVAKNRHGSTATVYLEWKPELTTFRNPPTPYDDAPEAQG